MSAPDAALASSGGELLAELERLMAQPGGLPRECAQRLLAIAVQAFALQAAADPQAQPFASDAPRPSDTDIAVTASSILGAAGIEIFELGLWRAWSGLEPKGIYEQ